MKRPIKKKEATMVEISRPYSFLFPYILISDSPWDYEFRVEFKDGVVSEKKEYHTESDKLYKVVYAEVKKSTRTFTYCYAPGKDNAGTLFFTKAKSFFRRKDASCLHSGRMHIDYTLQTVTFSGDDKMALQEMVETIRSNLPRFPKSSWKYWKMQMCFPDNTVQFEGSDLEYDYDPKKGCWPVEVEIIKEDLSRCSNAIKKERINTPRYYIGSTINYKRLASIWCRLCRLTSDCSVQVLSPYFVHLQDHYMKIKEQILVSKCQEKNTLRREILSIRNVLYWSLNTGASMPDIETYIGRIAILKNPDPRYRSILNALNKLVPHEQQDSSNYSQDLDYFTGSEGLEVRSKDYPEMEQLYREAILKPYLVGVH
jgi:hypothetical protein